MQPEGRRRAARALEQLTAREIEVLRQTAAGRTNADVAIELGISIHAVKFHLASIFRKLSVRNRTEAAAAYLTSASGESLDRSIG